VESGVGITILQKSMNTSVDLRMPSDIPVELTSPSTEARRRAKCKFATGDDQQGGGALWTVQELKEWFHEDLLTSVMTGEDHHIAVQVEREVPRQVRMPATDDPGDRFHGYKSIPDEQGSEEVLG
jgi:hypothetical protein